MSLPQQILVFAGEHQLTALVVQGRGHDHEAGRALRPKPPFAVKVTQWFPVLQRIAARGIGIGVRPEHIHTPEGA